MGTCKTGIFDFESLKIGRLSQRDLIVLFRPPPDGVNNDCL